MFTLALDETKAQVKRCLDKYPFLEFGLPYLGEQMARTWSACQDQQIQRRCVVVHPENHTALLVLTAERRITSFDKWAVAA